ncbi:UNVERIFIED_CONTAM: hypothetical protein FKN15_055679 [Acipenser sinensis]
MCFVLPVSYFHLVTQYYNRGLLWTGVNKAHQEYAERRRGQQPIRIRLSVMAVTQRGGSVGVRASLLSEWLRGGWLSCWYTGETALWLIPGARITAVVYADALGRQNKLIPGASITLQPSTPGRRISTSSDGKKHKWMEMQMDHISLL